MDIKDMAVVESTGTSSRIKEQNEKHEKFVGRDFLFFFPLYIFSLAYRKLQEKCKNDV